MYQKYMKCQKGRRIYGEKIEVNEYVRTDNGEIYKVIDIEKGSIKIKSQYQYKEWIGYVA